MKVGELQVGTLVMASGNWEIISSAWPTYERTEEPKTYKKVDRGEIGVTVAHAWKREARKDIMMFVGTSQDDFQWGGVRRHHNFLWNGKGVIMTGYDIRYLETVEDGDK
jgi:hypothetical protein